MNRPGVFSLILVPVVIIPAFSGAANASDIVRPADKRFTVEAKTQAPEFRRHVVPLLGRLGCNGRACHGSLQGRGGFRLSLFGYDFVADHQALMAKERPRVHRKNPAASLILRKPTHSVDHGGGRRFPMNGWEYRLLRRWIEAGAPAMKASHPELTSLRVEPAELSQLKPGARRQLRVIARWSDGVREDVTPLCRFRANDDSVATISAKGIVKIAGRGDTHVIVFYDNGIAAVPVIVPLTDRVGTKYPNVATPTKIDRLVVAKLKKLGIVPSKLCTDAEFLRRVSLDITGTLPAPGEITAFLADKSPDKRKRKIDELLKRPGYAAWWTTKLCDLTGNAEQNLPVGGEQGLRREKSRQWYEWIHRRVAENVPYDDLVAGIVLGVSRRPNQSDDEYFAEMSSYFRERKPADFAKRKTMPYFWTRGRFTPPQPLRFSFAFLGIRIQCAQCHKHPFDQWTKEDFEGFQTFFEGVRYTNATRRRTKTMKQKLGLTADQDSGKYKRLFAKLAKGGTVVPWYELRHAWRRRRGRRGKNKRKYGGRVITPTLLGGKKVLAEQYDDPRQPLMEWLRHKENPYFARAFVNRVWAHYFGRGIIDPPDDLSLANPPGNKPLLDYLAKAFVEHGYDIKWLHREITGSRTYQLSWRPNATNAGDTRNFSRAQPRRLPAEMLYDILRQATASHKTFVAMQYDKPTVLSRAIGVSTKSRKRDASTYALKIFGQPDRDQTCDCARSNEPTLLQTLYLRNDAEVLKLLDRKDGWLKQLALGKDTASKRTALIREAFLRTLSRPPMSREVTVANRYLSGAKNTAAGMRDLLWALLNTKEFIVNH